jgi:hypothetical protein
MDRNSTIEAVHTRGIYNIIESGALTLDTNAYAANDYLCTNYITYSNAFLEQTDCLVRVLGFRIRETITTGALQKPGLKLLVFNECDITATANGDFDFADGTNTDLQDIAGALVVAASTDYVELKSGANTYDAIANVYFSTPLIVPIVSTNRYIKIIPLTTGTPTFPAATAIHIDLIVEMD